MKDFLIDLPVAIIFFNRPDTLKEVFRCVSSARPSRLFLIQDGPRESNQSDIDNIRACRNIVSNIDWNCQVTKFYSDINLGCGERVYTGLKSAFNIVDRLVILEDDIIVSKSFFYFCKEMLEKYKNDYRIIDIAGMNICETNSKCPYSYFFSEVGSCWGWATWARSWHLMEYDGAFLNDKYAVDCYLNSKRDPKRKIRASIKISIERRTLLENGKKLSAWAHQFMMAGHMNSGLTIVPQKNLIRNIGDIGGTHTAGARKLMPRAIRKLYSINIYDFPEDYSSPNYVIADPFYKKYSYRILGIHPIRSFFRRTNGIIRRLLWGEKKEFINKFIKRKR